MTSPTSAKIDSMDQITTGVRRILSAPFVYDALQSLLGGTSARKRIVAEHIRVRPGDVVVDVGCGTAELLRHFPQDITYHGFDLSPDYIDAARKRFPGKPQFAFHARDITTLGRDEIPPCDLAIAFGVLHHVNDAGARGLLENLYERLAPGGRLVTIDNLFVPGQAFIARELIKRDRGQHVRDEAAYRALVPPRFRDVRLAIHHDLLRVPYTHVVLEATK